VLLALALCADCALANALLAGKASISSVTNMLMLFQKRIKETVMCG
jgi:hypothetical protein